MKRFYVLLLVLLFVTAGSACGKSPENGGSTDPKTPRNLHMTAELYAADDYVIYLTHYLENGCRKFMYYDKGSGVSSVLCGKPECMHDTDECNAVVATSGGSVYGMGVLKNKICWIADKMTENEYQGKYLYRMNLDGTGREEIRMLWSPEQQDQMITGGLLADYSDDYVIVGGGRSGISSGEDRLFLTMRAFSLSDPDKDIILFDEENSGSLYFCVSGKDIYYSFTTQEARAEGEAWKQDSRFRLYRYSLKTKETEAIFDDEVPFCPAEFSVDGNRIVIAVLSDLNSVNESYILDLQTKKISGSVPMEEKPGPYGAGSNVDHGKIACYSYPSGDRSEYRLLIRDYDGNVISDTSGENTMADAEGHVYARAFAGSDTDWLYYFFRDHFSGYEQEWLMAYPVKGGEPILLYTDAREEEPEEHAKTEEDAFRVEIRLDAEKTGGAYYVNSFDDLQECSYTVTHYNNTDFDFLDYTGKFYVFYAFNQEFYVSRANGSGYAEKFPAQTTGVVLTGTLDSFSLIPGNFDHGMTKLRYEVTGTLNGEEITAEDEITLYVRDEMGE